MSEVETIKVISLIFNNSSLINYALSKALPASTLASRDISYQTVQGLVAAVGPTEGIHPSQHEGETVEVSGCKSSTTRAFYVHRILPYWSLKKIKECNS